MTKRLPLTPGDVEALVGAARHRLRCLRVRGELRQAQVDAVCQALGVDRRTVAAWSPSDQAVPAPSGRGRNRRWRVDGAALHAPSGRAGCPPLHVTWVVDEAYRTVMGLEVSIGGPQDASIGAALRAAILREGPLGRAGGLPGTVIVDAGRDLVQPVRDVMDCFAVDVQVRPVHRPATVGAAERVHAAMTRALSDALPDTSAVPIKTAVQLRQQFAEQVWQWAGEWNRRPQPRLEGLSPLQAWLEDPGPVDDVPDGDLLLYLMHDSGRTHRVWHAGIAFDGRRYTGRVLVGREGDRLRVRWATPTCQERVEVCDLDGRYLGPAFAPVWRPQPTP